MLSNYLKIAFRGFAKNKLTFFINLFGLSLGLWAAILIGLWVKSEISIGRNLPGIEQAYRIMEHQTYGPEVFSTTSTPGILSGALKEVYPEVEKSATYSWTQESLFVKEENKIRLKGFYADPDYLHIMQYPLLHGDREKALTDISHIVLTEEAAIKLFGKTDVIGEELIMKEGGIESGFIVQGVLASLPEMGNGEFEYLLPFKFLFDKPYNDWMADWGNNGPNTIVRLHADADADKFSKSLLNFVKDRNEGSNVEVFAYPQSELYLHGKFVNKVQDGGKIEYVRLFSLIGLFVLIIACINFMNLSTAKSQKRAKEVGVRKVAGAAKSELINQFLSESILITFLSAFLALLLVMVTLPIFNQLTEKQMTIPYFDWIFWLQLLAIVLFTGLIAGSYPAFYLSATKVISVFRNHIQSGKAVVLARKGLVLFQFILATILIVSTMVVYRQIDYALNQDLGYKKDQLVVIPLEGNLHTKFDIFKTSLLENPEIESVTRSTHGLLGRNSNTGGVNWEGKDPDFSALFEIMHVDYDFVKTTGMKLIQGSDFSIEKGSDSTLGAVINRRAYDLITEKNPEASGFTLWGDTREITGVVENFHFQTFYQPIEPVIILLDEEFAGTGFLSVKPQNMEATLAKIQAIIEDINPEYPFQYTFMDENYAKIYQDDIKIRELAKYFSILTILISCLGLLGLTAHIAEQKTKEIGIRKVLGASTLSILRVINNEFILIVILSILIGSGTGYWLMNDWLNGYAFHIDFEWWFIPLAAGIILGIALVTVTIQSVKAARSNPVQAIKSE